LAFSLIVTTFLYGHIFREAWRQNRHHLHQEAKTALMMVFIFAKLIDLRHKHGLHNNDGWPLI
jgi:hypothetical protein